MIVSIALFILIGSVFAVSDYSMSLMRLLWTLVNQTTREDLAAKHWEAAGLATAASVAIHELADAHAKRARHHGNLKRDPRHDMASKIDHARRQYHRDAMRFYRKKGADFAGESAHHLEMHALSQNPETKLSDGFIRDSFNAATESCCYDWFRLYLLLRVYLFLSLSFPFHLTTDTRTICVDYYSHWLIHAHRPFICAQTISIQYKYL